MVHLSEKFEVAWPLLAQLLMKRIAAPASPTR